MQDPQCLFCRIATGDIPKEFVFQNDEFVAFADIHPLAPVHLLIIPREHIMRSVAEMTEDQASILGRMLWQAKRLAEAKGIDADGYRLVFNVRKHAGQEVDHVHLHLLGGEPLKPLG